MATITLRSVKGSPLTNTEMDDNFSNINTEVGTKLNSSNYTASDVLSKLLTVDGTGSGLDAALLEGYTQATANTPNTIVRRDSSGNFSAGTVTASFVGNLSGNASTVTNGVYTSSTYDNPSWLVGLAGSKVTGVPNSSLVNSSITINGSSISLGGSINILGTANTWTAIQTFRDNLLYITDDLDTTKILRLQLSGISSGATRVLFVPDETGTIATQSYVQTAGQNSQGTKTVQTVASGTPSNATGVDGDIIYQY